MSGADQFRTSRAIMTMEVFPHTIKQALISDPSFMAEYGLTVDAVVSLGGIGASFQRKELFRAVRRAFNKRKKPPLVVDQFGGNWEVTFDASQNPQRIVLSRGEQHAIVVHLALLSPTKAIRLNVFRYEAARVGLPAEDRKKWEALLSAHAPSDDEHSEIHDDFKLTPTSQRDIIGDSLDLGGVAISTMIPHSGTYYERLAGEWKNERELDTYIADEMQQHIQRLVALDASQGYRESLRLASHNQISSVISSCVPPPAQIEEVWTELAAAGDMLSLSSAIEMGLTLAQSHSSLRSPLGLMIERFVQAQPVANAVPYNLLSTLITFVYGEMAHARIAVQEPPWRRRLSAIAHATIFAQSIAEHVSDARGFLQWARATRSQAFVLQCYVDSREEPRWLAEMMLPSQLRNELGGRVWAAAQANAQFVEECGWTPLLLNDVPGSLRQQVNVPQCFLPGPLEGGVTSLRNLPETDVESIRADLAQSAPLAAAFSAMANIAFFFRLPEDVLDLAATALDRANYYLQLGDGDQPVHSYLLGLAVTAASNRHRKLADALFIVLRNYRLNYSHELDADAAFRIAMMACASRSVLGEWCECVGNFITEWAFHDIASEEAERLHSHLLMLCHFVPELWITCGQAEAALQSILAR
jgi:hypothetical protein